jgi:glucokinase
MRNSGCIGIDVGGTKTRMTLFDADLRKIHDVKFTTPKTRKQFASELRSAAQGLAQAAKTRRLSISAIGIGAAASTNMQEATIKSADNLPFLAGFSFREALAPVCDSAVVVMNDLQAALYGELTVGKAAGYKDVIAIFIGTGIGGAVAIDGKLHLGMSGEAGNIGQYLVDAFGPLAGSERHGVLDDVGSRLAIAGTAATFALKHWAPNLMKSIGTDVNHITSSVLARAIQAGDKVIEELVRSRVKIVGIVLSNLIDFLSPQMIVLGGGLTEALPKIVLHEVRAGILAHSSRAAVQGLRIVTARYKGHAVAIGAARFAIDSKNTSSSEKKTGISSVAGSRGSILRHWHLTGRGI